MSNTEDALRERLEAISEELADLALRRLREAVERGEQARPDSERRLTRARRSVDKAVALLGDGADGGSP